MMNRFTASAALLLALAAQGQDAFLNTSFVPRYWKANQPWTIAARVRNASSSAPLITFRVDWRFNNGPIQTGNTQSTTGIGPGQYWPYTHPIPFNQPAGGGVLKVWVVGVGESNPANDTLYFTVDVLPAWAPKSVLIEQFTGTWCQFCPAANAATNALDADPFIVVAKHHNNDELANASSTAYWAQFNANYSPSGVMEQEEFGTLQDNANYDQWGAWADLRKQGVSPVAMGIGADFNAWQRELTVQVNATFQAALSGQFTINAFLVEDNVPGNQVAAAPGYIHQQVVRHVFGGPGGTAGVIPATAAAGATYSHTYAFTVPEQWNHLNLRVVALVTEVRNGLTWTVNVADAGLTPVGIDEAGAARFRLWPNPSQGQAWVTLPAAAEAAQVELLNADGRLIWTERVAGAAPTPLAGAGGLPAGAYLVRLVTSQGTAHQRLLIER